MTKRTLFVILCWLFIPVLFVVKAQAQGAAPAPCVPPAQPAAPVGGAARGAARGAEGRGQAQPGQPGRGAAAQRGAAPDLTIVEIPGIVAGGVKWTKIWQQAG